MLSQNPSLSALIPFYSCCLSCFTEHKKTCVSSSVQATPILQLDVSSSSDLQNYPVTSLSASDMQSLFVQYPTLKRQLRQIYRSMQNRDGSQSHSVDESSPSCKPRTGEQGLQTGLRALQHALERGDAASDELLAFMDLLSIKGTH